MILLANEKKNPRSSSTPTESTFDEQYEVLDSQSFGCSWVESLSHLLRNPPRSSEVDHTNLLSEYFLHASVGLATVDQSSTRSRIYLKVIPALACQHAGISFAIFALAMVSLALKEVHPNQSNTITSNSAFKKPSTTYSNSTRQPYLQQAHKYYGRCLEILQHDISNLNNDNVDSVIASSMLLIPFELAYLRFKRHCGLPSSHVLSENLAEGNSKSGQNCGCERESQPLDFDWMKFIRGLGSLLPTIHQRWPSRESPLDVMFQWSLRSDHVTFVELTESHLRSRISGEHNFSVLRHQLLHTILNEGPKALAELHSKIQNLWVQFVASQKHKLETEEANLIVCLKALEHLDSVVQYFMASTVDESAQGIFRVFSTWIAPMDDAFLTLLSQRNTLALAVYSHFLVYMIPLEDLWWIGDLGKSSLKDVLFEVQSCVDCKSGTRDVNSELKDLFSWPNKVLKLCDDGQSRCC